MKRKFVPVSIEFNFNILCSSTFHRMAGHTKFNFLSRFIYYFSINCPNKTAHWIRLGLVQSHSLLKNNDKLDKITDTSVQMMVFIWFDARIMIFIACADMITWTWTITCTLPKYGRFSYTSRFESYPQGECNAHVVDRQNIQKMEFTGFVLFDFEHFDLPSKFEALGFCLAVPDFIN